MGRENPRAYRISPYLIEPAVWSEGSYLIGYSDHHREIRSFRIERMAQARLLRENFDVPEDFDEDALFEHGVRLTSAPVSPADIVAMLSR